jgi:hypothetical protein
MSRTCLWSPSQKLHRQPIAKIRNYIRESQRVGEYPYREGNLGYMKRFTTMLEKINVATMSMAMIFFSEMAGKKICKIKLAHAMMKRKPATVNERTALGLFGGHDGSDLEFVPGISHLNSNSTSG